MDLGNATMTYVMNNLRGAVRPERSLEQSWEVQVSVAEKTDGQARPFSALRVWSRRPPFAAMWAISELWWKFQLSALCVVESDARLVRAAPRHRPTWAPLKLSERGPAAEAR